jgi:hypothetical protein
LHHALTYRLQDGVLRHESIGRILHQPTACKMACCVMNFAFFTESPAYCLKDGVLRRTEPDGNICYDCAWLSLTALSTVTYNLWL